MQFLNLITFICFRLQNYTIFSIIYYLLFVFLRINDGKSHRMVVLYSFCFCFLMRFAWFC